MIKDGYKFNTKDKMVLDRSADIRALYHIQHKCCKKGAIKEKPYEPLALIMYLPYHWLINACLNPPEWMRVRI